MLQLLTRGGKLSSTTHCWFARPPLLLLLLPSQHRFRGPALCALASSSCRRAQRGDLTPSRLGKVWPPPDKTSLRAPLRDGDGRPRFASRGLAVWSPELGRSRSLRNDLCVSGVPGTEGVRAW